MPVSPAPFLSSEPGASVRVGGAALAAPDHLELETLSILAGAGHAAGSAFVQERLSEQDFHLSEPTVGRLLRHLDRRKLTVRVSNRGRELTDAGKRRLNDLRNQSERSQLEQNLLSSIQVSTVGQIVDVLIARRGLERETARLAAIKVTPADISELDTFVAQQGERSAHPGIHQLITGIADNRVIEAALALISHDRTLHQQLREILEQEKALYDPDFNHQMVDAIKKRDPEAAQRAMTNHMDRILEAVERFQSKMHRGRRG